MVEDPFTSPQYVFAALHLLKQELKAPIILVSFMEFGILVDGALRRHTHHSKGYVGLLDFSPCALSMKCPHGNDTYLQRMVKQEWTGNSYSVEQQRKRMPFILLTSFLMNNVETEQNTFRVGKPFQLIFKARIATSLGHGLQTTLALDFSSLFPPKELVPHRTVTHTFSKCPVVLCDGLCSTFDGAQHRMRAAGHPSRRR